MEQKNIDIMNGKIKNRYGEEYYFFGYVKKDGKEHYWHLLQKKYESLIQTKVLNYKGEDGENSDVNKISIKEEIRVIGLKQKQTVYYASDYNDGTLVIRSNDSGRLMLVTKSFKFVSKRTTKLKNVKEEGIIIKV